MSVYYSPSNRGFYDTSIFNYTLPEDAISIDREYYDSLILAQSIGKVIEPDGDGVPQALDPPTRPVSEGDITRERSRRVAAGTVVTVEGYGEVALQGRPEDQITLGNLAQVSLLRIQQGDTTTITKFRDRDNVDHSLTPPQIVDMWVKGTQWVSTVYEASWDVKDLDPIPLDYTDDKYWP